MNKTKFLCDVQMVFAEETSLSLKELLVNILADELCAVEYQLYLE